VLFAVSPLALGCAAGDEAELSSLESEVATAANPIDHGALPFGVAQTATLSSAAGFHAWQFTLSSTASVTLTTSPASGGPASVNTALVLSRLASNGTWTTVTSNNDGPLPPWSRISRSLSSGTYRALVKGSTTSVTGAFALSGTCSGAGCPASCAPDVELVAEDASALTPAITTFNAGARSGYTWCRVAEVSQYSTDVCPATPSSLQAVVDQLVNYEEALRGWSFADGQVLTAAQVAAIEPFTTTCSPGGPALATSVRTNVSSAPVQGWLVESEVPCHNCHEFGRFYVLWYPADGQVLLIPYVTGYDS
jgi:hypothetical protein